MKCKTKRKAKRVQRTSRIHEWRKLRVERKGPRVASRLIPLGAVVSGPSLPQPPTGKLAGQATREILSHLCKIAAAKKALTRLIEGGADPKTILEYLTVIREERGKPKDLRDIGTIPGVPLENIRKLPDLCRNLARQIASIDDHLGGVFVQARHSALRGALYKYGFEISKTLRARAQKGNAIESDTVWKLSLIGYVRTKTTKPRYEEISQLIRAFLSMNGDISKCSASSLKKLWSEHPEYRKHVARQFF